MRVRGHEGQGRVKEYKKYTTNSKDILNIGQFLSA